MRTPADTTLFSELSTRSAIADDRFLFRDTDLTAFGKIVAEGKMVYLKRPYLAKTII